jgi:hypothetical protein
MLDKASGYIDRLVKEAIEIRLHDNNFSRDDGFIMSRAWYPATNRCPPGRPSAST